jgi:hypothetical protein
LKGSRKNGLVATVSTWAFNVASHGCRDLLIYAVPEITTTYLKFRR